MKFALYSLVCTLFFAASHKFYFSETLIECKDDSALQITIKVFTDDWELATASVNQNTPLPTDSVYVEYLKSHFSLSYQNNQALPMRWIGYEKEGEFTYLYLESQFSEKHPLIVHQNILTETFSDQKNLVNYRRNGSTKSLYFFKESHPQMIQ